jgi:hypothetical protein
MLPGDTADGWNRLTKQYQQDHARGRGSYDKFWESMSRVDIGDVVANASGTVTATLTYHYRDGRVVDERTSFQLVRENGVLKINDSTVLSSSTR